MFEQTSIIRFFLELFVTGFVLGLGPCIVSCGIILPYIAGTKRTWKEGLHAGMLFGIGRIVTYTFLGGLAGFASELIRILFFDGKMRYYLTLYGGFFILLLGLTILFSGIKQWRVCQWMHRWDHGSLFLAGVCVALAPCVPLIGVLSYLTLYAHNYIVGSIGGAAFGIGTLLSPFLIISGILGASANMVTSERVYSSWQKISGIVVIALAGMTIVRAIIMIRG